MIFNLVGFLHSPRTGVTARHVLDLTSRRLCAVRCRNRILGLEAVQRSLTFSRNYSRAHLLKGLLSAMLYLVKRRIPKFTFFFKNTDEPMQAK
jgi:hypothetical protein